MLDKPERKTKAKGDHLKSRIRVRNIGTADGAKTLRFKRTGLEALEGKYLFVRVDRKQEVAESNEDNDRPWQVLR